LAIKLFFCKLDKSVICIGIKHASPIGPESLHTGQDDRYICFGLRFAAVDFALLLEVDCPCLLFTLSVLDLQLKYAVCLDWYEKEKENQDKRLTFLIWFLFSVSEKLSTASLSLARISEDCA
jgi:hypothetical protein